MARESVPGSTMALLWVCVQIRRYEFTGQGPTGQFLSTNVTVARFLIHPQVDQPL
jgi:hypothetical protein